MISTSVARLQSRVLRSSDELRAIAFEWTQLWERCASAITFQRPEWLLPWIDAYSPGEIKAIEIRHDGILVGLAPLLVYQREHQRVLAFMGGGVSDYLDILAAPAHESLVLKEFFQGICQLSGWDVLDLTDLPVHSFLIRGEIAHRLTPHDACSALSLPQTTDELLHLFSKRQRANLRNARSRLQKSGGGHIEVATLETLPEFLEDLFRVHTTRWSKSGQPGVLSDAAVRLFHRFSSQLLIQKNVLRLYRLRSAERTLAICYSLFERGTVLCYLQAFDPEYAYLSPGTQLMFGIIEDAVRQGIHKFDFLRGDEAYKQHWRALKEPTFRLQIERRGCEEECYASNPL
jgi:CelD/BcsL family acetyltransferase involved in cellulose biosynthesis